MCVNYFHLIVSDRKRLEQWKSKNSHRFLVKVYKIILRSGDPCVVRNNATKHYRPGWNLAKHPDGTLVKKSFKYGHFTGDVGKARHAGIHFYWSRKTAHSSNAIVIPCWVSPSDVVATDPYKRSNRQGAARKIYIDEKEWKLCGIGMGEQHD